MKYNLSVNRELKRKEDSDKEEVKILMKNRLIAIIVISALVVSAISLAVSWASISQTRCESGDPMPVEGFEGLGGRPGFAAGTFSLEDGQSTIIYWDVMASWHTVTGTVMNDANSTGTLTVTLLFYNPALFPEANTVLNPGNSVTGTFTCDGTIDRYCWAQVTATGGHVNGYYFGSFFPC
jgi:hypothetical protein